jgi:hypothetical protein
VTAHTVSTIITVVLCVSPFAGTAFLCWLDPAGLVDAKYGKKED